MSELKPIRMGKDQFRVVITPLVVSFLYFTLLYLLTFIKGPDDNRSFVYQFRLYGWAGTDIYNLSEFNVTFLAIWVSIRTINLNGNLGNVSISSLILGLFFFFLDTVFYLIRFDLSIKNYPYTILRDYIRRNIEFLTVRFLYGLVEFVVVSIIFAGIYFELSKNRFKRDQGELFPKS